MPFQNQPKLKAALPTLRRAREDAGQGETTYPDYFLAAILNHDLGTGGVEAVIKVPPARLIEFGVTPGSVESTNPEILYSIFFQYMETRTALHDYDLEWMVLCWYTDFETTSEYKKLFLEQSPEAADNWLALQGGGTYKALLDSLRESLTELGGTDVTIDPTAYNTTPFGDPIYRPPTRRIVKCPRATGQGRAKSETYTENISIASAAVSDHLQELVAEFDGFRINDPRAADQRRVTYITSDNTVGHFTIDIPPGRQTGIIFPLDNPKVLSPYAKKRTSNPTAAGEDRSALGVDENGKPVTRYHKGIDYLTTDNPKQPTYAISDGVVSGVFTSETYGMVVYVNHMNGFSSRYAHLSTFAVSEGQEVTRGQVLGLCGTTLGRSAGGTVVADHKGVRTPHLHFEILVHKSVVEGQPPPTSLKSVNSNSSNYRVDPNSLLIGAPTPEQFLSGTVVGPATLNEARGKLSQAAQEADSAAQVESVARAYDTTTALERDFSLSGTTRLAFYQKQEATRREVNTRINETAVVRS